MIGIIATEGETHFEFNPLFAKRYWFSFEVKLPNFTTDDQVKEWGFAVSDWYRIWVMTGDMTSSYDLRFWK